MSLNISSEMLPSHTFVTAPVMETVQSVEITTSSIPPGITTATWELHKPNLWATAAAAQLLLPEASVYPAPRSQISS